VLILEELFEGVPKYDSDAHGPIQTGKISWSEGNSELRESQAKTAAIKTKKRQEAAAFSPEVIQKELYLIEARKSRRIR
jgi:hypothetical protein